MTTALYLADRKSPSFQAGRSSVDVVCAGDSITGWNNIGEVEGWPFPAYPESLQRLCEPYGLTVANCGIAGEVSPNGIGQVRDYLELFPNARYLVLGYGANDLDKWPEVEATSPRIIENLDRMIEAIGHARTDADPARPSGRERVDVASGGGGGPASQAGPSQRPPGAALPGASHPARGGLGEAAGRALRRPVPPERGGGSGSSPGRSSGC